MKFRRATLEDGTLFLRVDDLRAQSRDVTADLRQAARIERLEMVKLNFLYNDSAWKDLPALFRRIFRTLPRIGGLAIADAVVVRWSNPVQADPRGDYVARALGQVERPAALTELMLVDSMLTGDGFERLEPFVAGIASLDVSGNDLHDAALRQLISWKKGTAALERLRFDDNSLTARGVHALVNDGSFPRLAELGLVKCGLGAASVRRITDGSLDAITALALSRNPIGDEGARVLAESEWCSRLERLELAGCSIGDSGAKALANAPALRSIGRLDLRGNGMTDRGRKVLHDRFRDRVLTEPGEDEGA